MAANTRPAEEPQEKGPSDNKKQETTEHASDIPPPDPVVNGLGRAFTAGQILQAIIKGASNGAARAIIEDWLNSGGG